jgi:hypothetical protein
MRPPFLLWLLLGCDLQHEEEQGLLRLNQLRYYCKFSAGKILGWFFCVVSTPMWLGNRSSR